MAEYKIEVVETSTRIVEVEAEDVSAACDAVRNMWLEGEIILDSSDFVDVDFNHVEDTDVVS